MQITVDSSPPPSAIYVVNGYKRYGKDGPPVLDGINLEVKVGVIYGLVGSSGCGKTTLLSCMVGLNKLDAGDIRIFNRSPRVKGSGIPGPIIGYMPQETALYRNLSILEVLSLYGTIYGMTKSEITQRCQFLTEFLNLPETSKVIGSLSGGQVRRVSLAASMIHEPHLLVLDEPTVGLDPVLRERIWNYMKDMVRLHNATIILTTHYIEEARFCDTVGVMRKGKMLTEESPTTILSEQNTLTLESAILKMCRTGEKERKESLRMNNIEMQKMQDKTIQLLSLKVFKNEAKTESITIGNSVITPSLPPFLLNNVSNLSNVDSITSSNRNFSIRKPSNLKIIVALVKKSLIWHLRVPLHLVMFLFIPVVIIFLINTVIGQKPVGLYLGIVNPNGNSDIDGSEGIVPFIAGLEKSTYNLIYYKNNLEALRAVENGEIPGYVEIPWNFSTHFQNRLQLHNFADNESIIGSTLGIKLDESNTLITSFIKRDVITSYVDFMKTSVNEIGGNTNFLTPPLKFHDVFTNVNEGLGWRNFIEPAAILIIMSMLSNAHGATMSIWRRLGYLDRDYVAGVKLPHVVIAHLISSSAFIVLQICMLAFFFLRMTVYGSWALAIVLIFCSSVFGALCGLLWAFTFSNESEVIVILMGVNILYIGSTGVTWPLESVTFWYRQLCNLIPITPATGAFRSILNRGWSIQHTEVWTGFLAIGIWSVLTVLLTAWFYKIRR